MSFDVVHAGTRHGQVKCFGRGVRDVPLGTVVGHVVVFTAESAARERRDERVVRDVAVRMHEGGFLVVVDGVFTAWADEVPAGLPVVSTSGAIGGAAPPQAVLDAAAAEMVEELMACQVCAQLRAAARTGVAFAAPTLEGPALTEADRARGEEILAPVAAAAEERARARAAGVPILSQERFVRKRARRLGRAL